MPLYLYEHTETHEIFEELRPIMDRDKPFIAPDGKVCERVIATPGWVGKGIKSREVFEVYRDDVRKANPKYVKFRDGHTERYDPTKHR